MADKLIFNNPKTIWNLISESNDDKALEVLEEFFESDSVRILVLEHLKKIFGEKTKREEEIGKNWTF